MRVTCVQPIDRLDMHASMAATCRSEAVQLCAAEAGALSRLFMACMPSTHARTERVNTVARLPVDGDALHNPMVVNGAYMHTLLKDIPADLL